MHPNLRQLHDLRTNAHHAVMRRFLEVLIGLHPADMLPPRSMVLPEALPDLLPHLTLTRVERRPEGGLRFKLSVVGQATANVLGMGLNNRYLDDMVTGNPTLRHAIDDRERVTATGIAVYRFDKPRLAYKADFARIELCHAPFADDGATVNHILSLSAFEGLT